MVLICFIIGLAASIIFYSAVKPKISKNLKILLITLRTILLSGILVLLLSPVINIKKNNFEKEEALILIDNSLSMNNEIEGKTKFSLYQQLQAVLRKNLSKKNYSIKELSFADGILGNKYSTNLSKTLKALNPNQRKIFILSDGWFVDNSFDFLETFDPIYTFGYSYKDHKFDVKISELNIPESGFVKENQPIEIKITSTQNIENESLKILVDNKEVNSKNLITSKNSIILKEKHLFDKVGLHEIKVVVNSDKKEQNTINNIRSKTILIKNDKPKIVCLTDELNWDLSFINRIINRDKNTETKIYRVENNSILNGQNEVNFEQSISEANILILANNKDLELAKHQISIITRFVESGRSLFFIGKPNNDLKSLLGINKIFRDKAIESRISFHPNTKRFSAFKTLNENKEDLPPLEFYLCEPKKQATTLLQAEMPQLPAFAFSHTKGKGRVFTITARNLWKFQLPDLGYSQFITDITQYLLNDTEKRFYAVPSQIEYNPGDEVYITLQAFDETLKKRTSVSAEVRISLNDSLVTTQLMVQNNNGYSKQFTDLKPGKYDFKINDLETNEFTSGKFSIAEVSSETFDDGFNNDLLQFISLETRGYFSIDNEIPELETAKTIETKQSIFYPIYKKYYLIMILLSAFTIELFLRRRWGLL